MRLGEYARWGAAAAGSVLWLGIAIVFAEGSTAKHLYRCRGRTFTGAFDDCFNDYLPVLEVLFVPAFILLTAFFFARFAFALFAPPPARRRLWWWLAGRAGAGERWPVLQSIALGGVAWASWRLTTYPLVADLLPFHLYWSAFAAWFALGALTGFLDRRKSSAE